MVILYYNMFLARGMLLYMQWKYFSKFCSKIDSTKYLYVVYFRQDAAQKIYQDKKSDISRR